MRKILIIAGAVLVASICILSANTASAQVLGDPRSEQREAVQDSPSLSSCKERTVAGKNVFLCPPTGIYLLEQVGSSEGLVKVRKYARKDGVLTPITEPLFGCKNASVSGRSIFSCPEGDFWWEQKDGRYALVQIAVYDDPHEADLVRQGEEFQQQFRTLQSWSDGNRPHSDEYYRHHCDHGLTIGNHFACRDALEQERIEQDRKRYWKNYPCDNPNYYNSVSCRNRRGY